MNVGGGIRSTAGRLFAGSILCLGVSAVALIGLAAAAPLRHEDATLEAGQATFLLLGGASACANWGGAGVVQVGTNATSVRRGLVSFDVSSLPAGTHIASAILSLYQSSASRGSGTVGVHEVTAPWAQGAGANTCAGAGATWRLTGIGAGTWKRAGADFDPVDEASVAKSPGSRPGWDRFDITSLVQAWVSGSAANDGVLLKLDKETFSQCTSVTNCDYWSYASDDSSQQALRPQLIISTTSPPAPKGTVASGTIEVNGSNFTSGRIPYGVAVNATAGTAIVTTRAGTITVGGDGGSAVFEILKGGTENGKPFDRLVLKGGNFAVCKAKRHKSSAAPQIVRSLKTHAKGHYRVEGKYSYTTVRGTIFVVADRCDGTLTQVTRGKVDVYDLSRKRHVIVTTGHTYLARAH